MDRACRGESTCSFSVPVFDLEEKKDFSYMRNDVPCAVAVAALEIYISEKHHYEAKQRKLPGRDPPPYKELKGSPL